MAAPMFHSVHVGVARILEMPNGVSSQPAASANRPIATARSMAPFTFGRSSVAGHNPKKICDVTTPAITRQTCDPLPTGHAYHENECGRTTILAVVNAQSTRRSTDHAGAA